MRRTVRRRLRRVRDVERFARLTVGGGVALVAGLWVATLSGTGSVPWLVGAALALLGIAGLAGGIRTGIDY